MEVQVKKMDLENDLNTSEVVMQKARVVKPDATELDAIKQFCTIDVHRKSSTMEVTKTLKELRGKQKDLKRQLEAEMKSSKCMALTKEQNETYSKQADALGFSMVPYVRIVSANKDSSITPELVQEALESITHEDFRETEDGSLEDKVKSIIMTHIRRTIRSFTETLRLMPSLPKGVSNYDILETSDSMAQKMFDISSLDHTIKQHLATKKQLVSDSGPIQEYKQKIESFFIRTGLTNQRIVVEGKPYKLSRRISIRKPKIGIGKLETFLIEILKDTRLVNPSDFRPKEIIRALQIQISSVAPETKSSVTLSSIKESKE